MIDLDIYDKLISPPLSPPEWVFTPVWIVLYILILASFLIYIRTFSIEDKMHGYIFFVSQMILNLLWTPIFFGFRNIALALIVVVLMDIFVFMTIREFRKVSVLSSNLLIPYLIWILFATYLNFGYVALN